MTADESMSLAEEFIAAFNAHDLDRVGRLLSDTFLVVSPTGPVGPYGWRQTSAGYLRSFPDTRWEKVQLSSNDEGFFLQILWTGTQAVPPTRRALRLPIAFRARVMRGKIETLHVEYDPAEVERQIGLPPGGLASSAEPATPAREDGRTDSAHEPHRPGRRKDTAAETPDPDADE